MLQHGDWSHVPLLPMSRSRSSSLGKRSHRKCSEAFHLCGYGEKSEAIQRQRRQIRHVLHDWNVDPKQDAMNWPAQIFDVVDVMRVDANQCHARIGQQLRGVLGQEWMTLEVLRGVPVAGPSRFNQNGLACETSSAGEVGCIDCLLAPNNYLDCCQVGQLRPQLA